MRVVRQGELVAAAHLGENAVLQAGWIGPARTALGRIGLVRSALGQSELGPIGRVRIVRIVGNRHDRVGAPAVTGVRRGRQDASVPKRRCETRCRKPISPCWTPRSCESFGP